MQLLPDCIPMGPQIGFELYDISSAELPATNSMSEPAFLQCSHQDCHKVNRQSPHIKLHSSHGTLLIQLWTCFRSLLP